MTLTLRLPHSDDRAAIRAEFERIRPFGGATFIMADPPWSFEDWSEKGDKSKTPGHHYRCMSLRWIASLPVEALAAKDCLLWLWATNPMIPQALEVMESWGFTFSTMGHWNKRSRKGKLLVGPGRRIRSTSEPFIIAKRGAPKVKVRNITSTLLVAQHRQIPPEELVAVIDGVRREHSRKPEAAYAAADAMSDPGLRVDLFARKRRDGWIPWGDQIDHFTQGDAA